MPFGDDSGLRSSGRKMLGTGMAGMTADKMQAYKIWQQQFSEADMNGEPFPQFEDWLKMQQTSMSGY